MKNKVVYIGTTYKCSACKCMENIMQDIVDERDNIDLKVCDYTELPEFIKINVVLTDFPTTIFVEDNLIKCHFVGTRPRRKVVQLMNDIGFK